MVREGLSFYLRMRAAMQRAGERAFQADGTATAKAGSGEGFCMLKNRKFVQECHEQVGKCFRLKVEKWAEAL